MGDSAKNKEAKKAAQEAQSRLRREKQQREHGMSWLLGQELDMIHKQNGKKPWSGSWFTGEEPPGPREHRGDDDGKDNSFLGLF